MTPPHLVASKDRNLETALPRVCSPSRSICRRQHTSIRADFRLAADAAGAERARVGADLLERARQGFDVVVGEVPGEVPLDSVSVVPAGALQTLGPLAGEG